MRKITADISENTQAAGNEFTNGVPTTGTPATILPAEWLNTMQRELVGLVEGAGITLDSNNDAQVLAAVLALINGPGKRVYDAIVGTGLGATHATLAAALADTNVPAGSRILCTVSETLNAPVAVNKANLLIDFRPGITYSKGTASTGLEISAAGVRIRGGRFTGFSGGSDKAIEIQAGANYCFVSECRFASNTNDVLDTPNTSAIFGNVTE